MNFKKIASLIFISFCFFLTIQSCSHYDQAKKVVRISRNGESESHKNGENCMNCHSSQGNGEGWFSLAGSAYKTDLTSKNPNGRIFLYSEPNGQGQLKYTIEIDSKGNFYTTEIINFNGGLYPVHQNSKGNNKYMESPIITGQCQSCHNVNTDKIWND